MAQRDLESVEQPVQLRRELTYAKHELAERLSFTLKISMVIAGIITLFGFLISITSQTGNMLVTLILLVVLFVATTATLTLLGSGIVALFSFLTSTPELIQAARHDRAIRHEHHRIKSESDLGGALAISDQDADERGRLSMNDDRT